MKRKLGRLRLTPSLRVLLSAALAFETNTESDAIARRRAFIAEILTQTRVEITGARPPAIQGANHPGVGTYFACHWQCARALGKQGTFEARSCGDEARDDIVVTVRIRFRRGIAPAVKSPSQRPSTKTHIFHIQRRLGFEKGLHNISVAGVRRPVQSCFSMGLRGEVHAFL